jgi:hypothetical protein
MERGFQQFVTGCRPQMRQLVPGMSQLLFQILHLSDKTKRD